MEAIGDAFDAPIEEYQQGCRTVAAKHDIPFIDFVDAAKLKDEDFFDLNHLVDSGWPKFQGLLADETLVLLETDATAGREGFVGAWGVSHPASARASCGRSAPRYCCWAWRSSLSAAAPSCVVGEEPGSGGRQGRPRRPSGRDRPHSRTTVPFSYRGSRPRTEADRVTWYVGVLKQYAVFRGRARRKEYWMFILVNFLIMSLLGLLVNRTDAFVLTLLASLYPLAILLPWVSVTVRRLHDVGRSGWWALLRPGADIRASPAGAYQPDDDSDVDRLPVCSSSGP